MRTSLVRPPAPLTHVNAAERTKPHRAIVRSHVARGGYAVRMRPRMREVAGVTIPTEKGYALLGGPLLRPN